MKPQTDISKFIASGGKVTRGETKKAKWSGIWRGIPQAGIPAVTKKPDFRRRDMGMTEEKYG